MRLSKTQKLTKNQPVFANGRDPDTSSQMNIPAEAMYMPLT
jgi:hypothetical protein